MKHWTTAEVALLKREYPRMLNTELAKLLGRTVTAVKNAGIRYGLKKNPELAQGMYGKRFTAGGVPWNKGKPWNPPGAEKHRFKPGHVPHTHRPVGSERMHSGTLLRKVEDTRDGWRAVKDLVWEAVHGPIPAGHFVVCADRNPANVGLDNLLCITRAENMRRNSVHRKAGAASEMQRKAWAKRKATPFAKYVRMAAGLE